ncbi:MAG: carboxylating nicotinate-nucleotide diphosphorylase [Candidatus Aceula meridiana]|nr:carboxylating nicotinate-nucleotide diphosphorylase [Candidatus Aceula meridiana]
MPKRTHIHKFVDWALAEDIGISDITTDIFVPKNMTSTAFIVTHQKATFVGFGIVKEVFQKLDPNAKVEAFFKDGDTVKAETKIIKITGKTRALLTGERVALNFLNHLSAIATNTTTFIEKIKPYKIQIVDTRKTTPGFRVLEKWAVRCAKGVNHRLNLSEMVLIKDNHHLVTRPKMSLHEMIELAKRKTKKPICIEVENLKDFKDVYDAHSDIILLDNMNIAQIRKAVLFAKKSKISHKPMLEVSGGVNLKRIRSIAKAGIKRVSIGALTHTKKGINISMELKV